MSQANAAAHQRADQQAKDRHQQITNDKRSARGRNPTPHPMLMAVTLGNAATTAD